MALAITTHMMSNIPFPVGSLISARTTTEGAQPPILFSSTLPILFPHRGCSCTPPPPPPNTAFPMSVCASQKLWSELTWPSPSLDSARSSAHGHLFGACAGRRHRVVGGRARGCLGQFFGGRHCFFGIGADDE